MRKHQPKSNWSKKISHSVMGAKSTPFFKLSPDTLVQLVPCLSTELRVPGEIPGMAQKCIIGEITEMTKKYLKVKGPYRRHDLVRWSGRFGQIRLNIRSRVGVSPDKNVPISCRVMASASNRTTVRPNRVVSGVVGLIHRDWMGSDNANMPSNKIFNKNGDTVLPDTSTYFISTHPGQMSEDITPLKNTKLSVMVDSRVPWLVQLVKRTKVGGSTQRPVAHTVILVENSPGTYTKDHGGCGVRFPTFSHVGHPTLLAVNMGNGFCGISIQSSSPSLYDLDYCKPTSLKKEPLSTKEPVAMECWTGFSPQRRQGKSSPIS
uniref:Uncharacterized protein n=1 Tax=Timema douglasi TaxID=61478 RepID=A0A7R8VB08_TIMDO|nr:unnamed protein product [Timema douglasi]